MLTLLVDNLIPKTLRMKILHNYFALYVTLPVTEKDSLYQLLKINT